MAIILSILGVCSLTCVIRTPRLMSYNRLRACDTTYSRQVLQIYDRSYSRSHVHNITVTCYCRHVFFFIFVSANFLKIFFHLYHVFSAV